MGFPPVLPGGPPYRSGEDPEREKRLEELNRGYEGAPWLTALVYFASFLAVLAGSLVAVLLIIAVASGYSWWPTALTFTVLVANHAGLQMLRRHQREARRAGHEPAARPRRACPGRRR